MSRFIALLLSFTFFAQSVAFAVNPEEVSARSLEAQAAVTKQLNQISNRYEKLSDVKKLKFLNRQERRLEKGIKKVAKMSDRKFDRLVKRIDLPEIETDQTELSAEEKAVFGVDDSTHSVNQAELEKHMSDLKRKQVLDKMQKSLETIKEEKLIVAGKITKTDSSEKVSRAIASDTCMNISLAVMIAGAALFVVGLIVAFFTGGGVLVIFGGVGILMGVIGLLQCEKGSRYNSW